MHDSDPQALPRAYAELMSLAAHEFRTPASVIAGYLKMLQKMTLPEREAKMIDEAAKSCTRMVALIEELSEVAKIDDGRIVMALQPFDLFTLVTEVAATTTEAADRGVHLETRPARVEAPVVGDASRLRPTFTAFFRAVLREQPTAIAVLVDQRVVHDGGKTFAQVTIGREDHLAIAAASSPTVFDEARGGLGLALPIARRVVERHGGRVWSPLKDLKEAGVRNAIVVRIPTRD